MKEKNLQAILKKAVAVVDKKGYITFDDMLSIAIEEQLNTPEIDRFSRLIANRGIIIYDEEPEEIQKDTAKYEDYAQLDYDNIYDEIVNKCENLKPFIEEIKEIIPPQYGELNTLPYQVIDGNEYARTRMIEMHLRQALRLALQRVEVFELNIEDTIEDAIVGLINAVDKYEPDINSTFAGYMNLHCLQTMSRNQDTQNPLIYFPVYQKEEYFKIYPDLKEKMCKAGKNIEFKSNEIKFVMSELKCDEETAKQILLGCIENTELDEDFLVEEGKEEYLYEEHSSEIEINRKLVLEELRTNLLNYLDKLLSKREKRVILQRFGLNEEEEVKTLVEIGEDYGVSRERIRQIETKAIKKLKKAHKILLNGYLE